jgi:hypothetical protein
MMASILVDAIRATPRRWLACRIARSASSARAAQGLESPGLLLAQPMYAPETKVLGGQVSLGLGFGYGKTTTEADISVSPRGTELGRSDSVWGFTDLYPLASLAWNSGVHNWMAYVTGDIPVGAYDSKRLANLGIGHAAIDAGGGYTYLDQKTGREFSAVAGVTYNWKNTDTDYKNGVDSHLDWAVSQFLSANWQVGVAGYVYYQLSGDSGSGAKLGSFKSRVASIGPEFGYAFTIGGLPAYANLRGYWEFWAENRLEGYSVFATLVIPLGPRPATAAGTDGLASVAISTHRSRLSGSRWGGTTLGRHSRSAAFDRPPLSWPRFSMSASERFCGGSDRPLLAREPT